MMCLAACASKPVSQTLEPLPEGPLSVVVHVQGVRCCEGVLRLAVYNKSKYWMSPRHMVRGRLGFIQSEEQTFELHGLPPGDYAVAVYQDLDSNGKLDRWFGLIPKEPYGFSNNVGRHGPASFRKAAFNLQQDITITVVLNSWRR